MSISQFSINPYASEPIFGKLWQMFHDAASTFPTLDWEAYGVEDTHHKVYAKYKGETRAIGFAHELVKLSPDQFKQLIAIYFPVPE